jgi:hypothetical protein
MRTASAWVVALGLAIVPAARAEPPAFMQQEIDYLLRHIGESGCDFERNGTWSDARTAEAHVRMKYDYLVSSGRIDTTQDFIDKAATASSMSGRPYEVRCGRHPTLPTGAWLNEALRRYRAR